MKKSGKSNSFAVVCIVVLLGAYGVGLGVKKVRFAGVEEQTSADAGPEKPADEAETVAASENAASEPSEELAEEPSEEPEEELAARPERREGRRGMMGGGMSERFQNMSEEERQEAFAQMRERMGSRGGRGGGEGGGRGGFSQMSEDDRENLRVEMEGLQAGADGMSEEDMRQARSEILEKYGITPGRFGGGRPGGGEGGGRRPRGRE